MPTYFIGWDVGGWNCDQNPRSRDAIVILDENLHMVGQPWRGNLRETINLVANSEEWIEALFALCGSPTQLDDSEFVMAIDTPLGFPAGLRELISGSGCAGEVAGSAANPYLFRTTEQYLFSKGFSPLSTVKDMIGSQATKGMHLVAKLPLKRIHCGLWVENGWSAVIETYPAVCRRSALIDELLIPYIVAKRGDGSTQWAEPIRDPDRADALVCALVAYFFDRRPDDLVPPIEDAPPGEGWIWVPKDVLGDWEHYPRSLGWVPFIAKGENSSEA